MLLGFRPCSIIVTWPETNNYSSDEHMSHATNEWQAGWVCLSKLVLTVSIPYLKYLGNMTATRFRECTTGELGYDRLHGTRKIGPSYAKSVVYI